MDKPWRTTAALISVILGTRSLLRKAGASGRITVKGPTNAALDRLGPQRKKSKS